MTIKKLLSILLAFCVMFCMISIDTTPAYADDSTPDPNELPQITLYSGDPASTTQLITANDIYAANANVNALVTTVSGFKAQKITIIDRMSVDEGKNSTEAYQSFNTTGGAWNGDEQAMGVLTAHPNAKFIYSIESGGTATVFDTCGGILVYDKGWFYSCAGGAYKAVSTNVFNSASPLVVPVSSGAITVAKGNNFKYFGLADFSEEILKDTLNVTVNNCKLSNDAYTLTNSAITLQNRQIEIRLYDENGKYVKKEVPYNYYYVNLPTGAGFTTTKTSIEGSTTGFTFDVATHDGYETAKVYLGEQILTPTTTSSAFDSYTITKDNYSGTTDPAVTIDCKKIYIPPVVHVNPVYPISKAEPSNGTIALDKSFPSASDRVTITPTPDQGFLVSGVTVTTRSGKEVPVTANPDGTYSFISPSEAVEIDVDFVPEETELDKVTKKVNSLTLIAKSSKTKLWGKKAINLTWKIKDASGAIVDVDGVEVYRATAPYKNYKLRCIAKRGFYKNNQLNLNKKYRYKVRGYIIVDNEKVYTNWSNITVNGYKK